MSTQSPAKRRRIDVFEEFRVVLGEPYSEQKTVNVAKDYLTKSSDYFKKACSKDWKEGQAKIIELPDISPDTFAIYLQWLQTGEVVLTEEEMPTEDIEESVKAAFWHDVGAKVVGLYVLADYLLDTTMRNIAVDEWIDTSRAVDYGPNLQEVVRAYESTMRNCPLQRLFVDWYLAEIKDTWWREHGDCYPAEFLLDMTVASARLRDERELPASPWDRPKCDYHEHDYNHPKYA